MEKDNVYNLIIDNDSCENMVSIEIVEKLQLKIEKNTKPHKLKWPNQYSMIMMDERCFISFYKGNRYFDDDLCDVMSIDACNLLLGRP